MLTETVSLTIAGLAPRVDACELCGVKPEALRASVVIRHARGGTVFFAACSRCTAAVRRLIAAAGGTTASGPAHLTVVADDLLEATLPVESSSPVVETAMADVVGEPVVLYEFAEAFVGQDGQAYAVRAFGQGRGDGTWLGWLTFTAVDGRVLRTPRETTQSNREQLAYWASGLQPSYLEGAFRRAG